MSSAIRVSGLYDLLIREILGIGIRGPAICRAKRKIGRSMKSWLSGLRRQNVGHHPVAHKAVSETALPIPVVECEIPDIFSVEEGVELGGHGAIALLLDIIPHSI